MTTDALDQARNAATKANTTEGSGGMWRAARHTQSSLSEPACESCGRYIEPGEAFIEGPTMAGDSLAMCVSCAGIR